MPTCKELAANLGACAEGLSWLEGKNGQSAWDACERGDWMLWVLEHCPSISTAQKQTIGKEILSLLINELPAPNRGPIQSLINGVSVKGSTALTLKQQLLAQNLANRKEKHLNRAMVTLVEQKGNLTKETTHDTLVELGFHYCQYWSQKDNDTSPAKIALLKKQLADLVRQIVPTIPSELL